MKEIGEIKSNIYKIAAVTDRGQRLNKLISPMYEEKANEIDELIEAVEKNSNKIHEAADVFYHLLMYLEANDIKIEDVMSELEKRNK